MLPLQKIQRSLILILCLVLLYFALYKILIPRVLAFGCFDDCFAISSGFFLTKGKILYTDIFYNHQLMMPYISSLIQQFFHPQNVYELILRHRQTLLVVSFFFNLILILRFGVKALLFTIFYELSKFYFFGDRFLGEGLIIYPIVYMSLLSFEKIRGKRPFPIDYLLTAIFTWFVFFTREPYVPLAALLATIVFWNKVDTRIKTFSIFILLLLSFVVLTRVHFHDLFYSIYTFNNQTIINQETAANNLAGFSILKVFAYPFIVFVSGEFNFLRIYQITAVGILLISLAYYYRKVKDVKLPISVLIILGLCSIRYVTPGHLFFESYRLLIWHGVLISSIVYVLFLIKDFNTRIFYMLSIIFFISWIYILLNRNSYLMNKPNQQYDLLTNYGRYLSVGGELREISTQRDTLFLDGADELIYVTSGLSSSYKYSMYTAQMPDVKTFVEEKDNMLKINPPDFYFEYCSTNDQPVIKLGKFSREYGELKKEGKPSCLFINKNKIKDITPLQWNNLKYWGYSF